MKLFKIATMTEKSAYDPAGNRAFVPVPLREQTGDWGLMVTKTFSSRTNDKGEVEECEPWTRDQLSFIGSFKECVANKNVEAIAAKAEAAIVEKLASEFEANIENIAVQA